ncbi:hypothetical protein Vretimale_3045 [Volvox reticuliferus]|uniref:Uncharacterized protein n=1 Tax=Volvox reticuliferus TaxID=1737510 RepID=A0A8J4DAX7_9CHLO|nr:hypothetical protein Vretimale_3045 [Volvox reticuliferus]
MQPTEQSRQQLRCALRDLGARAEKFNEEDLNNLLRERYQTLDDLREARANSLRAAGLPLALVDHTVAVQRASAAGLGVRSAAGAGAAAGVGTTRAGDAGAAAGLGVGSGAGAEELPTPKPPQEPPTSTPTQPRKSAAWWPVWWLKSMPRRPQWRVQVDPTDSGQQQQQQAQQLQEAQ